MSLEFWNIKFVFSSDFCHDIKKFPIGPTTKNMIIRISIIIIIS